MTKSKKTEGLNKTDLINLIAEQNHIAKTEAAKSIGHFTKAVEEILARGEKLTLVGFGSFYATHNEAKEGRNPRTGEPLKIAASNTPRFKSGSDLKKACNKLKQ